MAKKQGDKNNSKGGSFKKAEEKLMEKAKPGGGAPKPGGGKTTGGKPAGDLMPDNPSTDTGKPGGGSAPNPTQPPMPTTPLPEGYEYIFDEASNAWRIQEIPSDRPPQPPPVPGYKWEWDEGSESWTAVKDAAAVDVGAQESLRAELRSILEMVGQATEGNIALIEQAVRQKWSVTKFVQEWRQSADYLNDPLFAANAERAKLGKGFKPEAVVRHEAQEAKRLARQYGFKEPSDAYIAMGMKGGLSLAEVEHRYRVEQRVKQHGAGVAAVFKAINGHDPEDQDLYEIFDPEISTQAFDDAARHAEFRGRPMVLGLGIQSAETAAALDLLGVSTEQAWAGWQKLAGALPSVERLAAVDKMIANDPENNFDSFSALFRDIFASDPKAQESILLMAAREKSRFNQKNSVQGTQGVLTGLLNQQERAAF